jgi:hypothetical protein
VAISHQKINQTTPYEYVLNDQAINQYRLAEVSIGARYTPYSSFTKVKIGYKEITKGYPVLSLQLTKGISDVLDSNFDYFKTSAKASYVKTWLNNASTTLMLEGHYALGDVPLTHLFHAYPNAPTKDEILQRFSAAGGFSFETMYFNEFFSDRLIVGQIRHQLPPIRITSYLQPEIVLLTRTAWGNLDNKEKHLNIPTNSLEQGYWESGIELNKLLFGFGLSGGYRYGAYHLDDFEDNISVKFTFHLQL